MTTGVLGVAARQDPRQVPNTLKRVTNWNDANIAVGVAYEEYLPQNAFLLRVLSEVVVTFDGTTPAYSVGTVGAAFNNIVAAGDVNLGALGVYESTRALGRALTAAGNVLPVAKYSNAGGGPTKGQVITVIEYEGGWQS